MQNIMLAVNHVLKVVIISLICLVLFSCKKYLDAKPDSKLVIPTATSELIKLLDNNTYLNSLSSSAGDYCGESFYYSDDIFDGLPEESKYGYTWNEKMFSLQRNAADWQATYNVVYYSNVVLEKLNDIEKTTNNQDEWNYCKGAAFTFRAKAFHELAQIWAKAYDSSGAASDMGIPLRLSSDFNLATTRASMKDTYDRIINDLQAAIPLLPVSQIHPFRPTKPAAYGMLARTFLAMRAYDKAGLYADSCLQLRNKLINYNNIDPSIDFPFQHIVYDNPEDILHSTLGGMTLDGWATLSHDANVDTSFLKSYNDDDLRKVIFFKSRGDGSYYYNGMYGYSFGDGNLYNGITTAEMLLIKAEVLARQQRNAEALTVLNTLLEHRWKTATFIPIASNSWQATLDIILEERHKELCFRGQRFSDIKRLNKEGREIALTRTVKGQSYTLTPNDPRWALPIPDLVIQNTGIEQN